MEGKGSSAKGSSFTYWVKPSFVNKITINFANPRIKIKAANNNYILRTDPEANKDKTIMWILTIVVILVCRDSANCIIGSKEKKSNMYIVVDW